jgi:hypothetical protein
MYAVREIWATTHHKSLSKSLGGTSLARLTAQRGSIGAAPAVGCSHYELVSGSLAETSAYLDLTDNGDHVCHSHELLVPA